VATATTARKLPLRLFNMAQYWLERAGRVPATFTALLEPLHEEATRAAGCHDFGDPAYRAGLEVLAQSYDREARLTPFGRMMIRQQILALLINRLRAERTWSRDPDILRRDIRRPLFILGLPRTGTTALHHLLGQDPEIQVLEYWLAAAPGPRPPREMWRSDPRFRQAERDLRTMYWLDPGLKAMHVMTADGAEECRHLLCQTFTDDTFECNATIPSYVRWYRARDMGASYRQHKRLLQLIGAPTPARRWLLKYPVHMGNLRRLLEVYPDACFVQTHRDPAKVIPSICSLVVGFHSLYEDDFDRRALAADQLELWASRLESGIAVRAEQPAERFFDLHFSEVRKDPMDAVRRLYDHFGFSLGDEAERRMRAHLAANPRGKHGEHVYSAEQFGLSVAAMRERFANYREHFTIEEEE
jgi:hypothetical protein